MAFVRYKKRIVFDDGRVLNKWGHRIGSKMKSNGYRYLPYNGRLVLEHRFIWEAFHGPIPSGMEIDHLNTIRDDNRLENLRLVTPKENKHNPLTTEHYKVSNKGKQGYLFHLKRAMRTEEAYRQGKKVKNYLDLPF